MSLPHFVLVCACAVLLLESSQAIAPFTTRKHGAIKTSSTPIDTYTAEAEADRVNDLPGSPNGLDFGLFSGYVTVDEPAGRALFYVLAEARKDAHKAPLLLWLNGGPGCSSLGGGFMSELGPFYPTKDGKALQENPYAWNTLANVLWLESPAFVGFSYSNTSADAIVGDKRTAVDARLFLLGFLKRFPQYAERELYLSGESYGGHYVPNLAWEIVQGNKRAEAAVAAEGEAVSPGKGHINLKGFFVGNAWTDAAIDNKGALDFWYSHAMIGEESYRAIRENCDFSVIGPLMRGSEALSMPGTHTAEEEELLKAAADQAHAAVQPAVHSAHQQPAVQPEGSGLGHARVQGWDGYGSSATTRYWEQQQVAAFNHRDSKDIICAKWLDIAFAEQGNINIYEIYADVCTKRRNSNAAHDQQQQQRKYYGALLGYSDAVGAGGLEGRHPRRPRYDPCVDGEVETYLNLPEVQAALHANQTRKLPWRWTDCTRLISYSRQDLLSSMLPTYEDLLTTGLKLWVFSGDVDGIVPVLGSRRWVEGLGLPVLKPWRPWQSTTGQVGGWRVDYQNLTFATVRNAGHMVPYVQPERAHFLLRQFLYGDSPAPSR